MSLTQNYENSVLITEGGIASNQEILENFQIEISTKSLADALALWEYLESHRLAQTGWILLETESGDFTIQFSVDHNGLKVGINGLHKHRRLRRFLGLNEALNFALHASEGKLSTKSKATVDVLSAAKDIVQTGLRAVIKIIQEDSPR